MVRNKNITDETLQFWKDSQEVGDLRHIAILLGKKSAGTALNYLQGRCTTEQAKKINKFFKKRKPI